MNENFKKHIQETLNFYLDQKKREEAFLKKALQEKRDAEELSFYVGRMCGVLMQLKFQEFNLQRKSMEGINYLSTHSNWKKLEKEIRAKFSVPKSVPLRFK